ncbi:MAG TPA: hypothetical protein VKT82_18635 [Ktedonobacterales bacterium]|nr:hypothetical protein [Ktedonobacterales bacterium]
MYTRSLLPCVIVLAHVMLASSCSVPTDLGNTDPPAADPPLIGVTPIDTSAATLIVTINIDEDQDAADHQTNFTFKFRTHVIKENNYVLFDAGQYVTCNVHSILELNTLQQYPLKVPRLGYDLQGYTCFYIGYTEGIGQLAPVPMIDVRARSMLAPQQPQVDGEGYRIRYTPDSDDLACSITADAIDAAHHDIGGSPSSSDLGLYVGPATNSLQGTGEIILKRICTWTLHQPFYAINLTYESTASVEVTWSH